VKNAGEKKIYYLHLEKIYYLDIYVEHGYLSPGLTTPEAAPAKWF
jgi:hypothetical protein